MLVQWTDKQYCFISEGIVQRPPLNIAYVKPLGMSLLFSMHHHDQGIPGCHLVCVDVIMGKP